VLSWRIKQGDLWSITEGLQVRHDYQDKGIRAYCGVLHIDDGKGIVSVRLM